MDMAEQGRVRVNGHVVAYDRMPCDAPDGIPVLVGRKLFTCQADALEDTDVITQDAGLADDGTRPVVYREMMSDARTGMDVDARLGMCQLRNDAWNIRHAFEKQLMGNPVIANGAEPGIAEDDFAQVLGRRVAIVGGFRIGGQHVFRSSSEQARQSWSAKQIPA